MSDYDQMREGLKAGTFGMWRNWAFPLAAVVIATLLGPFMSKAMMPLILFAEVFVIFRLIRRNRKRSDPFCFKIPYIIGVTLFWAGAIMVMFNMMSFIHATHGWNGQPYNRDMPYFPMLIIGPVLLTVSAWFTFSRRKSGFCTDCEARTGQSAERGFLGKIYTQEATYQTRFLLVMSLITVIVQWGYFMVFYININLNNTDRFFFIWIIVVIYFLSLVYMGIRYYVLWAYYSENDPNNATENHGYTQVRFLVICEDKLWLHIPDNTKDIVDAYDLMVDTPVKATIPFRMSVNAIDAGDYFKSITGIGPVSVRQLYRSSDMRTVCNIFHFAVFLDNYDQVARSKVSGEWFGLGDIQELHQAKILSPLLEAELDRIHRTVMAWKTYTRDGRRLYAIKHYKPTFRLSDMKKWDVDYNDPIWLFVAMNNEDRRFFKLRKLWRKYLTGLGI